MVWRRLQEGIHGPSTPRSCTSDERLPPPLKIVSDPACCVVLCPGFGHMKHRVQQGVKEGHQWYPQHFDNGIVSLIAIEQLLVLGGHGGRDLGCGWCPWASF